MRHSWRYPFVRHSRWQGALAPVLLLLIVIGSFWKITLTRGQYTWLESPDLTYQVLPWLQYQASEFHAGHFPLWDPYEWGGQSLIGQAQPGLAYPLNWILYAMPLDHGHIQRVWVDAYFILIHYLAALFCYWLCRDLGRGIVASIFGGSAFALSGWLGSTDWPQMLNGAVWAPLVFLFFLRTMRGERPLRNAALSGSALGISFLSGHHQVPIFTGLAVGGCWIYFLVTGRRQILPLVTFGAMFAALGAFQILPAIDYGKQALRWVGANNPVGWNDVVPYRVHAFFSMPPASLVGIVVPGASENANPFIGGTVLLMALTGFTGLWKSPEHRTTVAIFGAIAMGGLFLSFGQWDVFHGVLYALLPQVDKARNIAFATFLFGFAASVLSSFGIDALASMPVRWQRGLASFATVAGVLLTGSICYISQARLPHWGDHAPMIFEGALLLALGAILFLYQARIVRHRGLPLLLLALTEFGTSLGYGYGSPEPPASLPRILSAHSDIADFLRSEPGRSRAQLDRGEIPYNFGDWYGIDVYGGYLASLTRNVADTMGQPNTRLLMGVAYSIASKPMREGEIEIFHDRNGLKVFRMPGTFPRVWTVHETSSIPAAGVEAALNRPLGELRRNAFFIGYMGHGKMGHAPPVDKCSGDLVQLTDRGPNEIEIDASMQCRGVVVAAETFDTGWSATVDGAPTPLLEAYGTARAVVVPAGHHRIEMRFRPRSVVLGAILTTGFLLTLGLAFL